MNYADFLLDKGNFMENEIETNIAYDKKSITYLQILWYILDTYYLSKVCYKNTDENLTLKIKGLAEYLSVELGGSDINFEYIPHEHIFLWHHDIDILNNN